ncbi:phosphopantetheine binding protein [Aureococcus anophagefferens]|uniref:Phosphopantetheine binding protein n=1 Tax=Aureococcus anophagefferens TaxID=44056 RepID=A0ABR1G0F8_AURAN
MSEVFAVWEDALYDKRKPEIIQEVDTKYCCLVEWVEQPLPDTEAEIRKAIRPRARTLPQEIIDGIPKEDPKETGKLDILAFVDESGLLVPVWGNDDLLDAAKIEELFADEWDMLIFGAGVDLPESNDPGDIVAWSDRLIKIFLIICQLIQRKPAYAKKIFVLTCDTHGNEPKTWAEAGPGLTAASHLFGMCNTRRIECARGDAHPLRRRRTPKSGTIGIGGGNGALGLVMCKYLLERLGGDRATVTLDIKMLSRSCKISGAGNEKLWNDIKKLIAGTSITVVQESCGVSKREAIEKFVEDNAASLSGFIHSAGILRDALLMNQDAEKYDDVFKPKAWAGLYLNHALENAANSLLDSLARYRKSQGLPCTVMQWAGWGEVGMASNMEGLAKKRMDESPMPFFTNAQGLSGMDTGISTGVPNFCVMRYNTKAFFEQNNKEAKSAAERYGRKFWGCQAPSKELTELDLRDNVKANFYGQR